MLGNLDEDKRHAVSKEHVCSGNVLSLITCSYYF